IRLSDSLRTSARSRFFLSSAAWAWASLPIFSISSLFKPLDAVIRIDCSFCVARSLAPTWTMPFASMSRVTSIWGTPRGAGGMPTRAKWPSDLLSAAISRSPCRTLIVTADQHDLIHVLGRDAGVGHRLLARLDRALDEIVHQLLELGPRQLHHEVLRSARVGRDERQVDLGLLRGGELDLRPLGRFLEALQGHPVPFQVDALVLFELLD